MRKVIAALILFLLCSSVAYADTSILLGGSYYLHLVEQRLLNRARGGYVGVTSYLDYPSVGFTGSYSVYGADKVILYQDYPYERQVYDYENNVTLLKVLAGFRIAGFSVGGG
jgi:hypothetical protein